MAVSDSEGYRIRADDLRQKAEALRRIVGAWGADKRPELAALAANYDGMATTFEALADHVERHERILGRR
jgi:hypothetical protein